MHKRLDWLSLVYENNKYDIAPMLWNQIILDPVKSVLLLDIKRMHFLQ